MCKNYIYRSILRLIFRLDNILLYRLLQRIFFSHLRVLLLHIGNECNYRCRYCYLDKTISSLDSRRWLSILEEAKKVGVKKIGILGGEPLCMPELLRALLEKAHNLRFKIYVYTNGSLINEEWIGIFQRYAVTLVVKYEADNHDYLSDTQQQRYNLEDIESNIRKCSARGLKVITFSVLTKHNVDKVEQIIAKSLHLGALPAFERYLPVRTPEINTALEASEGELEKAFGKVLSYFDIVKEEYMAAIQIRGRICDCYASLLSITPEGEVLPCPYLPKESSLGNINTASLEELYRGMKERFYKMHESFSMCKNCKYVRKCGGGCYTYAYLTKGKYSPYCSYQSAGGFVAYFLAELFPDVRLAIRKIENARRVH